MVKITFFFHPYISEKGWSILTVKKGVFTYIFPSKKIVFTSEKTPKKRVIIPHFFPRLMVDFTSGKRPQKMVKFTPKNFG